MSSVLFAPAAPVSMLALLTTAHLLLVVPRTRRAVSPNRASLLTFASVAFAGLSWLMSSLTGLAVGLGAHLRWFAGIDGMKALLRQRGVPGGQVRSECFEAAVAASSRRRAQRDAGVPADGVRASAGDVEVRFARARVSPRARAGQTLLEVAEAAGIA